MNKLSGRKLLLSRETLLPLTDAVLARVGGGKSSDVTVTCPSVDICPSIDACSNNGAHTKTLPPRP